MLNLKRRHYPLSYVLGMIHLISLFDDGRMAVYNTIMVLTFVVKYRREGLRVNVFILLIAKLLSILDNGLLWILSLVAIVYYLYLSGVLTVYELPDEGNPVGHMYWKDGWIREYGLVGLSIYYPTDMEGIVGRRLGV